MRGSFNFPDHGGRTRKKGYHVQSPILWKRLSGLLLVGIMVLTPYVGEYIRKRVDAAYSAPAIAGAPEPSGLAPALAGFASALDPSPARAGGEDARSHDAALVHGIEVYGPAWFREKVKQALDLLKRKDLEGYELVTKHITVIRADKTVRKETGSWAWVMVPQGVVTALFRQRGGGEVRRKGGGDPWTHRLLAPDQ